MSKSRKNKLGRLNKLARSPEEIRDAVKSARSNVVVVLLLDNEPFLKQVSHTPAQILSWDRARGASTAQLAIETMLCLEGYTVYTLNINPSPSLTKSLRDPIRLDYVRDSTSDAIKSVLQTEEISFILVKEFSKKGRPHFHGAVLVPNDLISESLVGDLEQAIANSSPCRKYKELFDNKAVRISSTYKLRADPPGTKRPVDSGWGTYITKEYKNGKNHVMSNELTRLSKDFTERIRKHEWHILSQEEFKKLYPTS